MKSYIKIISGVYPDGVVYVRREGKIIAAKIKSYRWKPSSFNSNDTYVEVYRADGVEEYIYMSSNMEFYATIEDAINNNKMDVSLYYIDAVTTNFGFCYLKDSCITALGKIFYRWDGFKAIPTNIWSCYTELIWDNQGWYFKLRKEKLHTILYNTEEECRKDNHVDVITF